MGYEDWIELTLRNLSDEPLEIRGVWIAWGKFYKPPNKDDEIRPDGILIPAKSSVVVGACGRENSPSGCEAAFDVAVKHSGEVTRRIYWDCPYTGRNTFRLEHPNGNWVVDFDPIPGPDGPIGSVTVRFFKVG